MELAMQWLNSCVENLMELLSSLVSEHYAMFPLFFFCFRLGKEEGGRGVGMGAGTSVLVGLNRNKPVNKVIFFRVLYLE